MADPVYINVGAGTSVFPGWLNYDASLSVRIQHLPLVGPYLARLRREEIAFPPLLLYGDIVRGLPLPNGVATGIYASHVLEHLSLTDLRTALSNTLAVLKSGGIFRLVVPDLATQIRRYIAASEDPATASEAVSNFIRGTHLGLEEAAGGIWTRMRRSLGHSAHLWMWDYPGLSHELLRAGFADIRHAELHDCVDPRFAEVEQEDRWYADGHREVTVEARKP